MPVWLIRIGDFILFISAFCSVSRAFSTDGGCYCFPPKLTFHAYTMRARLADRISCACLRLDAIVTLESFHNQVME